MPACWTRASSKLAFNAPHLTLYMSVRYEYNVTL